MDTFKTYHTDTENIGDEQHIYRIQVDHNTRQVRIQERNKYCPNFKTAKYEWGYSIKTTLDELHDFEKYWEGEYDAFAWEFTRHLTETEQAEGGW